MESSSEMSTSSSEDIKIVRKLSLKSLLAFGVGHVLNDVCSSIWFSYLLVYLHLVLKFENWEAGLLLLVGQIADAAANPIVGNLSDKLKCDTISKLGKRKFWHLLGTICIISTFPFAFLPCLLGPDTGRVMQLLYYSFFTVIFQVGWAAVQISHLSLIPELSPNESDRTKLAAFRYCFTVISNLFVYIVTWGVMGMNDDNDHQLGPADVPRFQCIIWSGMIFGIVCSIVFHFFVKEGHNVENDEIEEIQQRRSIKEILTDFQHYKVAVIYMCTMLFVNLSQVFIPLYLHESLGMSPVGLAMIPLTVYIGSFVVSLVVDKLNTKYGRKVSYSWGTAAGLIACLYVLTRSEYPEFVNMEIYVMAVLFGIACAIILVTNLGITSDLIGDKTGSGGLTYSLMTVTDKMANGLAVFAIENVRKFYPSKMYYRNILGFVCGGSIIVAMCFVSTLPKPTRNKEEYTEIP